MRRHLRSVILAGLVTLILATPAAGSGEALERAPLPTDPIPAPGVPAMSPPVPEPSQEPKPIICVGNSSAGACVTDEPILIIKEYVLGF